MVSHSNLLIADRDDVENLACSDDPGCRWPGFAFNGLDGVKIFALLSLLKGGSPDGESLATAGAYGHGPGGNDPPHVSTVGPDDVAELAVAAAMGDSELDELAMDWGATQSFMGWSEWEVGELLRRIGDLAETAMLQEKCLVLWHGR